MTLSKILKMSQEELLEELNTELFESGYNNILATKDYIYAKGEIPILLVAHLDTVHKTKVKEIFYDKKEDTMWSPQGIGGDDRCGVYVIIRLIKEGLMPHILFTTDEEKGGIGARRFCEQYQFTIWEEIKYMIEIDRRGNNQAVFYKCGNQDFQNYVLSFGFEKQYGTFSDISVLSPNYDIASVNLSAGYYNEHTLQEYIKIEHLTNTINKVRKMLKDKKNEIFYDYQEKKYEYNGQKSLGDGYDDIFCSNIDDKYWDMYDDWSILNDKQFKEKYNKDKPKERVDVWYL